MGRYTVELAAALELLSLVHQAQVGLMNQFGRLERMPRALAAKVTVSQQPQFAVDDRRDLIERGAVAVTPALQQQGEACIRRRFHQYADYTLIPRTRTLPGRLVARVIYYQGR